MQIRHEAAPLAAIQTEALILPVFEGQPAEGFGEFSDSGEVKGKFGECTVVHRPQGFQAKRVLLAGAGKAGEFSAAEARRLAGVAVRHLREKSILSAVMSVDAKLAQAAVEGAILGDFEPDQHKGERQKPFESFAVTGAGDIERGRIIAESANFTRELANEPANRLTPLGLADRARAMADEFGLGFEVLDQDRMMQLGMGALLGVAQGSAEPPALIILRYRPESAAGSDHLGLVGKGVTFDTGGISIKPADGMEKMKYDMSGGAAMIGAMRALAQLKPAIPVTALIPAVENMPGSRAQRPGDIVRTLSGKTVEVLNTDAEGRLILADAITYAKNLGCTHLVDAATLTGAIVVALGHLNVGLFANNDDIRDRVQRAAQAVGEKMWPMPLDEEYKKEYLKSAFADIPNIGGRWGGAVTAAMFLKEFADPAPWVHLDIAGTAWLDDSKPWMAKGPSGVPVRTMVHLAMNW